MADSRKPGPLNPSLGMVPSRPPCPLGMNDSADPRVQSLLGDTPGPLGLNDYADPTLPLRIWPFATPNAMFRFPDGTAVSAGSNTCPNVAALNLITADVLLAADNTNSKAWRRSLWR